jgi:hypothetical protein
VELLRDFGRGFLSAVLPEELRRVVVGREGTDVAAWSALLGLLELFAGGLLLIDNYLRNIGRLVDQHTGAFLDAASPRTLDDFDAKLALYWSGSFSWAVWLATPTTWLLVMFPLVGLVRLTAFATTREPIPEPLVWLAWQGWRRLVATPGSAARRRLRYGSATRPDRLRWQPDGSLLVLTARPRPEWNELVTIQLGERFYRLVGRSEREEDGWRWHVHRLREEDPSAVIRALLRYEPPPGAPTAAGATTTEGGAGATSSAGDGPTPR